MGYRNDDFINDERADAGLRQALERMQALDRLTPPPDLVTRTARRLPAAPPAVAARQIARRAALRFAARIVIAGVVALIALFGVVGVFGGGERLAQLFGDGGSGMSRALLTIQLLAKPLWHSIGSGGAAVLVAGILALAGAAWLWWWTLRRTPIYYAENAP
jgi:hypothetical protein